MPQIMLDAPRPLSGWLRAVASIAIAAHLLIFLAWVIGAPSGPWQTQFGPSQAEGPYFVRPITEAARPAYLLPLRMTHNYHFDSNAVALQGVYFEVHLRDEKGQRLKSLKFPDDKGNPWARHRQQLLARNLGQDQPIEPLGSEIIAPVKQKIQTVTIWEPGEKEMTLKKVPLHLIPRDRPVMGPSEWSLILAQSYMRHLCREHNAASAELVRHSRDVVWPSYLFIPDNELPPNAFETLNCNFGEYRRGE